MVFDPISGGGANTAKLRRCDEPPCPLEYEYATGATYVRQYVGYRLCDPISPSWMAFSWSAVIPPGTRIRFEFRGASSALDLASATAAILEVDTPSAEPALWERPHVSHLFLMHGLNPSPALLEIRAILLASDDARATPTLSSFSVDLVCAGD